MPAATIPQAFEIALQHHRAGRLVDAEEVYRQILAIEPNHTEAQHLIGVIALQDGRHHLAVEWISRALLLNPAHHVAHSNLGQAYRALGQFDDAIDSYRRALEFKPDYPAALSNLGDALRERGQLEEAVTACRRALQFKPDYPAALNNLGNALKDRGDLHEAIAAYRRAIQLDPVLAEAYNNLGDALAGIGDFDEAILAFRRAVEIRPTYNEARYSLSLLLLLRGDFEHGWPLYEARWDAFRSFRRDFPVPSWNGEPMEGRSVLIHSEQGFGDSLQFIRYAPLVAERGCEVIVQCPRALVDVFRSVAGVSAVVADGDSLPPFDLHIPMLSQPLVFGTVLHNIPRDVPYLFANPDRRQTWRERLGGDRSRLRVGLAWAGNPLKARTQKRDIALVQLLPILSVEGIDFFSLQMQDETAPLQSLPDPFCIIDYREHIHDFADTAAFMMGLDLIISVDTAVAHLAGALGVPVWTLLPFVPDWRWGLQHEDTPWYPTMRLFRQPALGAWDIVIQRVAAALRGFLLTEFETQRATNP